MIKVEDNRTVSVPSDENWDNLKWLAKRPISKLGADEGENLTYRSFCRLQHVLNPNG